MSLKYKNAFHKWINTFKTARWGNGFRIKRFTWPTCIFSNIFIKNERLTFGLSCLKINLISLINKNFTFKLSLTVRIYVVSVIDVGIFNKIMKMYRRLYLFFNLKCYFASSTYLIVVLIRVLSVVETSIMVSVFNFVLL